ncbi:YcaO-like family protein [Streptomyces sp. NPDC007100]|uniref:YcaO-like family protein n=1 Tax=Streptomyces sp. NPDC007100 TaxID=3155602 RepID=UPI0033E833A2
MDTSVPRTAGGSGGIGGRMPVSGTERAVPLAEAARRVTAALKALGLEAHLTELGDGGEPTAWRCELRTPGGDLAPEAQGAGKGTREEARVGALFEALEHHLTGPTHFVPTAVEHLPAAAVAQGLAGDVIAPLLQEAMSAPLACHRYRRLDTGRRSLRGALGANYLAVPVFLACPWYIDEPAWRHGAGDSFDYAPVGRYSCNSGSAIGVGAVEAAVHALNEAIERDAFSLLLARTFLGAHPVRVIDPATLPGDLAHALEAARHHAGQPVHLLDITTDLGVPTVLAYSAPADARPHRRGCGTSLDARYAVWRALSEHIQGSLTGDHTGAEPVDLSALDPYPELLACARFDLTPHLAGARTVAYRPTPAAPRHPDGHLAQLTRILAMAGHPPYHRIVARLPGGITAVHTLPLGLERFILILDGAAVLPGERAVTALSHSATR